MLTLITPTRDRSKAFGLLEGYISRQTYKGPLQWVVVNDGSEIYKYNAGQEVVIRSTADDKPEHHSITYNYAAGLKQAVGSKVLFIEDDDWYHPDYIQVMSDALDEVDLVGLTPAFYYHVLARRWRNMRNPDHASLAATGMNSAVVPEFMRSLEIPNMVYMDIWLWCHWPGTLQKSARLIPQTEAKLLQVGMKGLPWGCRGIGLGHDPVPGIRDDLNHTVLRRWIGKDYLNYYGR